MPTSREEIVAWLRDGANEISNTYRHMPKKTREAIGVQQIIDKMRNCAAQVENMRCEYWRRIDENTPKDREILLFCPTRGVVTGSWYEDKYSAKPRPYWDNSKSRLYGIRSTREDQPTHWMPLPPVPGNEATDVNPK